jgi:tetratricopeptide (TPR) repeat protein
MKKTVLVLFFALFACNVFAQDNNEAMNTNKWIDTYSALNAAKDWNGMISKMAECRAEVPNWDFADYYEGVANFNLGNYPKAIEALTAFIQKNQTTPAAFLFRGNAYLEMKEASFAIKDYDEYLKATPNDIPTMLSKAQARMINKDYANYILDLTEVLKLDPKNVDALSNRAAAYAIQKDWNAVVADLTSAIALNEKPEFYYDRGFAQYSLKTPESIAKAIEDFSKAEQLGMITEKLYSSRAACNKMLKKYAEEVADYTLLIELNPSNVNYYYNRGVAAFKANDFKRALIDFDKTIELNPKHVNAYKYRANTKGKLGDKTGQAADVAKVKELTEAK